jgi:hypothetical protein
MNGLLDSPLGFMLGFGLAITLVSALALPLVPDRLVRSMAMLCASGIVLVIGWAMVVFAIIALA